VTFSFVLGIYGKGGMMMILPSLHAGGSIEQAVELYKSTVYGIALTRTKNRHDADDVFQEVFLTYHRKQPSFNGEDHRKAWLIKTTVNCAKKFLNKNPQNTLELTENLPCSLFEFRSEEQNDVYAALCELPEKYRTVLYLYYFEGLSVNEIAKASLLLPGTVRMQMKRGREMMREKLKGEYFYER